MTYYPQGWLNSNDSPPTDGNKTLGGSAVFKDDGEFQNFLEDFNTRNVHIIRLMEINSRLTNV